MKHDARQLLLLSPLLSGCAAVLTAGPGVELGPVPGVSVEASVDLGIPLDDRYHPVSAAGLGFALRERVLFDGWMLPEPGVEAFYLYTFDDAIFLLRGTGWLGVGGRAPDWGLRSGFRVQAGGMHMIKPLELCMGLALSIEPSHWSAGPDGLLYGIQLIGGIGDVSGEPHRHRDYHAESRTGCS